MPVTSSLPTPERVTWDCKLQSYSCISWLNCAKITYMRTWISRMTENKAGLHLIRIMLDQTTSGYCLRAWREDSKDGQRWNYLMEESKAELSLNCYRLVHWHWGESEQIHWLAFCPSVSGTEVRILSLQRMQSAMGECLRLVCSGHQQGENFFIILFLTIIALNQDSATWELTVISSEAWAAKTVNFTAMTPEFVSLEDMPTFE